MTLQEGRKRAPLSHSGMERRRRHRAALSLRHALRKLLIGRLGHTRLHTLATQLETHPPTETQEQT